MSAEELLARYSAGERDFRKARLQRAHLREANLRGANLAGADLFGADLHGATLSDADLSSADLRGTKLYDAHLDMSILIAASLGGADLRRAGFGGAKLFEADLRHADLRGAVLERTVLINANLTGVSVDSRTRLDGALVHGARVQRITLESLADDYGGLSRGDRITMRVDDDVATLREEFSGFMQWIHLGGILLFLSPYVWFLALRAWSAQVVTCGLPSTVPCKPLYALLWKHAWTDQLLWGRFALVFYIFYNLFRLMLMFKTKRMELQERARGLPVLFMFATSPRWHWLYLAVHWGFWINVTALVAHTMAFLTKLVPAW